MTMTVDGDERLAATSRAAAADLADMDTANRAVGEVVRARAASNAPKVSGALASSLRADSTAVDVVVYSTLAYAAPINFGWPARGIASQPFITNALNDAQAMVEAQYAAKVGKDISQVRGK